MGDDIFVAFSKTSMRFFRCVKRREEGKYYCDDIASVAEVRDEALIEAHADNGALVLVTRYRQLTEEVVAS